MHVSRVFALPLVAVAMLPFDTRAAASLMVDDASITDAGRCQLESWGRHTDAGNEWTAVPACTIAGTEWSLGVSHQRATAATQWAVGAKRVLRDLDQRRWGVAVSAGVGSDWHRPRANDWNLNAPLTVALGASDRTLLHLNLGWARTAGARGRTDGVGLEIVAAPHWSLLAETARDATRQRSSQFGVRHELWRGASVDLLAGRMHHQRDGRWLTLGFNLAAAP
ncbi:MULTISPECIES: hypothetical protein [Stenotrophomonas]|uniref:Cellulose biosynthesis protein BcsS n=1 Tax=Stenotrophomonas rhizophila TaxID=216778 RepID=A0A498CUG0_9GAMM|nr:MULTISPECIES: hypothetical protein [Stenotrophomonas]MBU2047924.1 hypothetical protein [Gammaproteobacteria bacterium]RLK57202.1 hypothetical protein BCL79_1607 [Stenotrophomonas rhizophila]